MAAQNQPFRAARISKRPSGGRTRVALALVAFSLGAQAAPWTFRIAGEPGGWPEVFSAVGLQPVSARDAGLVVIRPATDDSGLKEVLREAPFLVLEGDSGLARQLGFRPGPRRVKVHSVEDVRRPKLAIIWERGLDLSVFEIPAQAQVFVRERWTGAPLVAGIKRERGAVLWTATDPGRNGYERFPYLLNALADLGLEPPLRSRRLWAFFDSSYRARADLEYLARRWRSSGIAALHVAAWHFLDEPKDAYLRELIESCHRNAILVYAWLELPHVSERFWNEHPQWREKTAMLQDAHLDWRKLMNLASRECHRAVLSEVRGLLEKFDWDGVNLAELYFESLEGVSNPARFTPMNDDVRTEFRRAAGFDPLDLFQPETPRHHSKNGAGLRAFLDFRAALARRVETEWIGELEALRTARPGMDLVLTHVDDYFDSGIRDAIGADAARLLPLLEERDFTFLVEDPATVWHLGPRRYPEIARHYRSLTRRTDKLAVDINVVERYQDVYPTKQQTGTELFQLVRRASEAFPRVALYFENSILAPDLPLLPSAAAVATRIEASGERLRVESPQPVGVVWQGPALVDGRPWPAGDGTLVWLPAGSHVVTPGEESPPLRMLDFNGELKTAAVRPGGLEFAYRSSSRALAIFDHKPVRLEVDGSPQSPVLEEAAPARHVLSLPRGQHLVRVWSD